MINSEQLHCGIYDSTLSRKYMTRTPVRETVRYELELYHNDKGICFVDGAAYPVLKNENGFHFRFPYRPHRCRWSLRRKIAQP